MVWILDNEKLVIINSLRINTLANQLIITLTIYLSDFPGSFPLLWEEYVHYSKIPQYAF